MKKPEKKQASLMIFSKRKNPGNDTINTDSSGNLHHNPSIF